MTDRRYAHMFVKIDGVDTDSSCQCLVRERIVRQTVQVELSVCVKRKGAIRDVFAVFRRYAHPSAVLSLEKRSRTASRRYPLFFFFFFFFLSIRWMRSTSFFGCRIKSEVLVSWKAGTSSPLKGTAAKLDLARLIER